MDDGGPCRPALLWDAAQGRESDTLEYWSEDAVECLVVRSESDTISSISHKSLCALTSLASRELLRIVRQEILTLPQQTLDSSTTDTLGCLPVAIAIPEGIYLPIAVATVYALNHDHFLGSDDTKGIGSFAIIPLDPNQGIFRLKHMIDFTQPRIILTSGASKDRVQLETAIAQSRPEGATAAPGSPAIVDFCELVESVAMRLPENSQLERASKSSAAVGTSLRDRLVFGDENVKTTENSASGNGARSRISHIVFTSGSTGKPKACVSSIASLEHYLRAKNLAHHISSSSTVLLASSLSFDPCLSDILASLSSQASLALAPPSLLKSGLDAVIAKLCVTHVLCTPTLWSTTATLSAKPSHFPSLEVVALGGEPISSLIRRTWARHRGASGPRLLATYGVTEACVYQTAGEIYQLAERETKEPLPRGQNVGLPFPGLGVRICQEQLETWEGFVDVEATNTPDSGIGEVVLFGQQIDSLSSYLNQDTLSKQKFIEHNGIHYYRTGDRGFVDKPSGNLHILGRCKDDVGMVKINGVRVELREIELAVIDDESVVTPLFVDCMAVPVNEREDETAVASSLTAYVVLSPELRRELSVDAESLPSCGVLCTGPMLVLLRERCTQKARVVPNTFVAIPRMFLSPTGKRDRQQAPPVSSAATWKALSAPGTSIPLRDYGRSGWRVAEQIQDCLNLQPSQAALLTTSATFPMLGGDSLAATRVVRALYAIFHNVDNNRFLGGKHGVLEDERFSPIPLLQGNLGSYVDFLDQQSGENTWVDGQYGDENSRLTLDTPNEHRSKRNNVLDEGLLGAVTQGQPLLAIALLQAGASPDGTVIVDSKKHRLSKISSRNERKGIFASTPLHYACLGGEPELVRALLEAGAKANQPDASGLFPLHLAVGGSTTKPENQNRRWEAIQILLDESNVPLTIKDCNKQTIVHAAARSGKDFILTQILVRWNTMATNDPKLAHSMNWRDRWGRTPVHWSILNGHVGTLSILLDSGCLANPPTPKTAKATSAALESPTDLCLRLYGSSEKGVAMMNLLQRYMERG